MKNPTAITADLQAVFARFPIECLEHLQDNRHRLIRGLYQTSEGQGCPMYLLSEKLPAEQRIDSRKALTRFFGDGDPRSEKYQPAKWIVRLWDRQVCPEVRYRYGERPELSQELLFSVLEQVLAERQAEVEKTTDPVQTAQPAHPDGMQPSGWSARQPVEALSR